MADVTDTEKTTPPEVWAAEHVARRENYLGRLELIQRLLLELQEEQRTAIIEAHHHGAGISELRVASGLNDREVRRIIRERRL